MRPQDNKNEQTKQVLSFFNPQQRSFLFRDSCRIFRFQQSLLLLLFILIYKASVLLCILFFG